MLRAGIPHGVHEVPLLAFAERKHVPEKPLGLVAVEEVLLVGRALIGVARRHRNANTEFGTKIEKLCDLFGRVAVENGGVDVDRKSARLGSLDRRHRAIKYALLRYRLVVMLAQTIEMHREKQVRRWLEQV